jgi:predicted amidohydrolase
MKVALASLPYPASPEDSVSRVLAAIADAGRRGAAIVCFPECYVPGYRGLGHTPPPPDAAFLANATRAIASAAREAKIAAVVGSERLDGAALRATVLVVDRDGTVLGFQDKVQLDPSEDEIYRPGAGRRVFTSAGLTFGIAICHEGWRYPETVRWSVRHGAEIVFHPHYHPPEPDGYRPTAFADPANTFHEKAALCRAAENTCYFATVNYATAGSATTSAVIDPNGKLVAHQPYGEAGVLIVDIDPARSTRLLANRLRPVE